MNATWILGNGFDLNIGLKTGYPDFCERRYDRLEDAEAVAQRAKLQEIVDGMGGSPRLWSDLEVLLGKSTAGFADPDEHHACFQRMKTEMEAYLEEQQARFDAEEQNVSFFTELADSIADLPQRLDVSEREEMEGRFEESWLNRIEVITLNYTNCLEASISAIGNKPPDQAVLPRFAIVDSIIHAHGTLQQPRQVVFAVASADQASNPDFRFDSEFRQCWTKPGLDAVYGNGRLESALTAIAEADVIASFGCSFGPTDEHLWRAVGERMRTAPATCFVCFDRSLPEKGEDAREYLRKSTALKNQLASAFGLPKSDSVLARIITVSSSRVFRFDGERVPQF